MKEMKFKIKIGWKAVIHGTGQQYPNEPCGLRPIKVPRTTYIICISTDWSITDFSMRIDMPFTTTCINGYYITKNQTKFANLL